MTEYERVINLFEQLGVEFAATDLLPLDAGGVRGATDIDFYGIPEGTDVEQKIDVGQTTLFFDHAGRYVGLGQDEIKAWQPRREQPGGRHRWPRGPANPTLGFAGPSRVWARSAARGVGQLGNTYALVYLTAVG